MEGETGGREPEMSVEKKIDWLVMPRQPRDMQETNIEKIREATKGMLLAIANNCPRSSDRCAAIRKVREAAMFAKASVMLPQVDL